nr:DUF6516 family protein [Rhodoplanes roseus]
MPRWSGRVKSRPASPRTKLRRCGPSAQGGRWWVTRHWPGLSSYDNINHADTRHQLRDPSGPRRRDFSVDLAGAYVVRFVVGRVPASVDRPHGPVYSLTLHGPTGERLVGFDNAHGLTDRTGRRSPTHDHRHRLRVVRPYDYRDAATLLADFWAEVDGVLEELGVRT